MAEAMAMEGLDGGIGECEHLCLSSSMIIASLVCSSTMTSLSID